jgi:hypothetical protein
MSNYFESELQRIIAATEENEKISAEYSQRFFRIFMTVSEAREILKIIKSHRDQQIVQSTIAG